MPKTKSGNFDQNKYVLEYMKQNISHMTVSINRSKEADVELAKWIRSQPEGVSGYLKRLAREDKERAGK